MSLLFLARGNCHDHRQTFAGLSISSIRLDHQRVFQSLWRAIFNAKPLARFGFKRLFPINIAPDNTKGAHGTFNHTANGQGGLSRFWEEILETLLEVWNGFCTRYACWRFFNFYRVVEIEGRNEHGVSAIDVHNPLNDRRARRFCTNYRSQAHSDACNCYRSVDILKNELNESRAATGLVDYNKCSVVDFWQRANEICELKDQCAYNLRIRILTGVERYPDSIFRQSVRHCRTVHQKSVDRQADK